jgi:hypothetical protein
MIKNSNNNQLATLVYIHAMRKEIEKEVESRYSKRIEYLVGANNELMNELEQWERVGKRLEKPLWKSADMKEEYSEEGGDELLHEEGGVDDGNGISEEDKQEYEF